MRRTYVRGSGALALVMSIGAGSSASLGAIVHTTIFQTGGGVPGGGTISGFSSAPTVNASGRVAAVATSTGGPSDLILAGNGSASAIVGGTGGSTPIGGTFGTGGFSSASINNLGDVYFVGVVSGGSATSAVFKNSGGVNSSVLVRNSPSPIGGTFAGLSSSRANNAGQVVFTANVTGGTSSSGLFRTNGTTTVAISTVGQSAPSGGTFTSLGTSEINDAGHVVFASSTSTGGGLFLSDGATISTVATNGGATPFGGTFSGFTAPTINNAGRVAFNASITGGSLSSASFIASGASLSTLAIIGDTIDGLPGLTIAGLSTPKINNNGVAVFRVILAGPGVDSTNDTAYVIGTNSSNLSVLVREGDTISVGGVPQVLTGNLQGNFFSVSDNGFAWRPSYASGSAVLYSSDPRFSIPSPGAAAIAGLGAVVLGRRRR